MSVHLRNLKPADSLFRSDTMDFRARIDRTLQNLQRGARLYEKIVGFCQGASVVDLSGTPFFGEALEVFGPALEVAKVKIDLSQIFDVVFHAKSRSVIVANKGATHVSLSPFTSIHYMTRHIACSVYHPDIGVETVNIGLVGNVYEGDVILRAESACPPSFLFGSQKCNCCYQWASVRELAAYFNPVVLPQHLSGDELEKWAESQFTYSEGKHYPAQEGQGLVLMHLDSQAGMGGGLTEDEFVVDLYNRALMRQLGEITVEQIHDTSMKESYDSLGIFPDSRRQCNEAGYRTPVIVLEWLGVSRSLIALSNNKFKLGQLRAHGFDVKRVKSLGKISKTGQKEAKQRSIDFEHLDLLGEELTFDEELSRLKSELGPKPTCV